MSTAEQRQGSEQDDKRSQHELSCRAIDQESNGDAGDLVLANDRSIPDTWVTDRSAVPLCHARSHPSPTIGERGYPPESIQARRTEHSTSSRICARRTRPRPFHQIRTSRTQAIHQPNRVLDGASACAKDSPDNRICHRETISPFAEIERQAERVAHVATRNVRILLDDHAASSDQHGLRCLNVLNEKVQDRW